MSLFRTLVRLKLLPPALFAFGFLVPIFLSYPRIVPFTYMASFFVALFGATMGLVLHMGLAQNKNVQGDPVKEGAKEKLTATLDATKQWLDKQPESTQRAFVFELATNLTITIRTSLGPSPETGTIQMANELLHWVVQWLQSPNTFKQTASQMLDGANLAFTRAEDFRPAPDVDQIIFAFEQSMKRVQL